MPYENPEPGTYWGYRCVKCNTVIALSRYTKGYWYSFGGPFTFTLDCVDWECQHQAEYPLAGIRPIEVPPVTELTLG